MRLQLHAVVGEYQEEVCIFEYNVYIHIYTHTPLVHNIQAVFAAGQRLAWLAYNIENSVADFRQQ